ncbi:hypothetical protein GCM10010387_13550 [Streptomyces inusitatus]|uniref:Tat pathway signal sequence domain protein n=1 Tax=Streptomyces inusitatus TaxID=68221 RepID=A0A918UN08_9ACTN|nr:hypothetical protein [Streptomyces inusitatus]GGZ21708.1 hypothetical protein GCM10010387_13550 [Streptomyces inusitatus]
MNRRLSATLATAVLAGSLTAISTPAQAAPVPGCVDAGKVFRTISAKSTKWVPTNIHSDWARPGVNITYAKNKTGSWTLTNTIGAKAELNAVLAKASASYDVALAKTWSKSDTWRYSAKVERKAGKTKGRLMMFHEAKRFAVKKTLVYNKSGRCAVKTVYKKTLTAPVKRNVNVWGIQYS